MPLHLDMHFEPSSPGCPLPEALLSRLETFFQADLSDVRIHEGAQDILPGAAAFTCGSHIYFATGCWDVSSPAGLRLLGHELTHVLQQRSGWTGRARGVLYDSSLERHAEALGQRLAASRAGSVGVPGTLWRKGGAQPRGPLQAALPGIGPAETLGWFARNEYKKEPYRGEARLGGFDFAETFKKLAHKEWKQRGLLAKVKTSFSKINYARVTSMEMGGQPLWVPFAGTGLDHKVSADVIGGMLLEQARRLQESIISNSSNIPDPGHWLRDYYGIFHLPGYIYVDWGYHRRSASMLVANLRNGTYKICPTKYAGAMYYHDFPNLEPMLSRDNSSKNSGSSSKAVVFPTKHRKLVEQEAYSLYIHTQWLLNLTWNSPDELEAEEQARLETLITRAQQFVTLLNKFKLVKHLGSPYVTTPFRD